MKRELKNILLLCGICVALLGAMYLSSNLRKSWGLCRRVESERSCAIYHARGEFFSSYLQQVYGPQPKAYFVIQTWYGKKWKVDLLDKERAAQ